MNTQIESFASAGFFTSLCKFFEDHSVIGLIALYPHMLRLLLVLAIIDIGITWSVYEGKARFNTLITKVIKYGFILFLLSNYDFLTRETQLFFQYAGFTAAGLDPATSSLIQPSGIIDMGFNSCSKLFQAMKDISILSAGGLGKLLIYLITIILTLVAFFFMAIQVMLTRIEFSIFSTLAIVFIPFGVLSHTQFLFQRAISGTIGFGVKFMVLSFIIGLVNTYIHELTLSSTAEFSALLKQSLGMLSLGLIVWKIADLAQNVMSGSASMSAGGVIGTAVGAVTGAAAAGAAVAGVAAGAAGYKSTSVASAGGSGGGSSGGGGSGGKSGFMHGMKRMGANYLMQNTKAGRAWRRSTDLYLSDEEYAQKYGGNMDSV